MWLSLLLLIAADLPGLPARARWEHRLDADDFWVREQASRDLSKNGSWHDVRVMLKSAKPEVRLRARPVYNRRKGMVLKTLEPFPFIDSMYYSTTKHGYQLLSPCQRALMNTYMDGYSGPPWVEYRQASGRWAEDMIDYGVPVCAIRVMFWELRKRDADFLAKFNPKRP